MKRRRYRKQPTSVSLFPFLAVLICTMGALIVLLVLGVQQAHVQATEVGKQVEQRQESHRSEREKMKQAAEAAQWKWDVLVPAHVEKKNELSNQRDQLGHLEDDIRRLERKWKTLAAEARRLRETNQKEAGTPEQSAAELKRLQAAIAEEKQKLDDARKRLAEQPRSYTLIPYKGPNGTQRRPLYVECTEAGITLQPEGIRLDETFFQGPIGPGNPLAAALRAKRDFLIRQGVLNESNSPYPLIVVRPGGSAHYALAREAMKSWEDEFGYELIAASLPLKFPPKNEAVVGEINQAIEAALQRQEFMARAQPRLYESSRGVGRRSSSNRSGRRGSARGSDQGDSFNDSFNGGLGSERDAAAARSQSNAGEVRRSQRSQGSSTGDTVQNGPDGLGGPQAGGQRIQPGGGRGNSEETNWGLPASQGRGLKRYVRVACEAGRLTILPIQGERAPPRVINVNGPLDPHVDQFTAQLWAHMKTWGLALPGRYWEPILSVQVVPGGESRFRELVQALQRSGIQVRRKP